MTQNPWCGFKENELVRFSWGRFTFGRVMRPANREGDLVVQFRVSDRNEYLQIPATQLKPLTRKEEE